MKSMQHAVEPHESLKAMANRLAGSMVSGQGHEAARVLHLTGGSFGTVKPAEHNEPDPNTARVGIWERVDGKAFTRMNSMMSEWPFWANQSRIAEKGAKARVVLIGESVARGYFYDPSHTPAQVLQEMLCSQAGREVEVVDLARSAIGLEVRDLALAATALEPDALVMFCGNNWSPRRRDDQWEAAELSEAVFQRGVAGYKEQIEAALDIEVRAALDDIASHYDQLGIPVLWIVPEFNLGDWRDPVAGAPHLSGQSNAEWLRCHEIAQSAMALGDFHRVAEAALRLIELDGGVVAAGYYLLADAHRSLGDLKSARENLELARDAAVWDTSFPYSPRTTKRAQQAIRDTAAEYGNELVDSPQLFLEHLGGAIPGQDLFLDYCHLTSRGIKLTMSSCASSLLRVLTGADVPREELVDTSADPSVEVQSEASFLAAVHNAHFWQPPSVTRSQISESFRLSSHLVPVAVEFAVFQSQRTPMSMGSAAERMSETASMQVLKYMFGESNQQLDRSLISAIVEAVDEDGQGLRKRIDHLHLDEHDAGDRKIDLLDYYYSSSGGQHLEMGWQITPGKPDYYRAFSSRSEFVFVAGSGRSIQLELTCRVPHGGCSQKNTMLYLNNGILGQISCSELWTSYEVELPAELLLEGLNEIALVWPVPDFPADRALSEMADDVLFGRPLNAYCSFGEIHAMTVLRQVRNDDGWHRCSER